MFPWVTQLFIRMVDRNCAYIGDWICRDENSGLCPTCFADWDIQWWNERSETNANIAVWAVGSRQRLRNVNERGAKFATKCSPTLVCCNSVPYNSALAPAHCGVARCDDPRVFACLRALMCVRVFASLFVGCSLARSSAANPTFCNRLRREMFETRKITDLIRQINRRSCAFSTRSPTCLRLMRLLQNATRCVPSIRELEPVPVGISREIKNWTPAEN